MAPEQALGEVDRIDTRSDQFSLACIAYEMLSGREPFWGDSLPAVIYQVVHKDPAPLESVNPEVPSAVAQVIRRGMAKDPTARFPTVREFHAAFTAAAGLREAPRPSAPVAQPTPRPDRPHRARAAGGPGRAPRDHLQLDDGRDRLGADRRALADPGRLGGGRGRGGAGAGDGLARAAPPGAAAGPRGSDGTRAGPPAPTHRSAARGTLSRRDSAGGGRTGGGPGDAGRRGGPPAPAARPRAAGPTSCVSRPPASSQSSRPCRPAPTPPSPSR
jgi:serine/threonine-protein kinase